MLKQGGTFKVNKNEFKIIVDGPIVTSRGEKDGGITSVDVEARF